MPVLALGSADVDLRAAGAAERLAGLLAPGDAVVVAAALTPDRGRDIETFMRNLLMGQQIAGAVAKTGSAHLIYVSSDAVYDDTDAPITESTCPVGPSLYATMHVARERMLREVAAASDIPFLVLRPSLLYGPGDTHNAYGPNRFVRSAKTDGVIAVFGGGEERRDHVWVRDLTRLVELAIAQRTTGILNVATGRSLAFGEVASAVAAQVGGAIRIESRPRTGPITHRQFEPSASAAFPGFTYASFESGLAEAWRESLARGDW